MKTFKCYLTILVISLIPVELFAIDNPVNYNSTLIKNHKTALPSKVKDRSEFPYRQILSFYPAKALANYMMIGYERQMSPKGILKVAVGYANFTEPNGSQGLGYDIKNFSAIRFDLMYKCFIGKDAIIFNGIYVAPYFSFKSSNFKYGTSVNYKQVWESGEAQALSTGFIVGLHTPLSNSFCLDMYLGEAMLKSMGNYKQVNRTLDSYQNQIGIISGLSVGFGF